MKEIFEQYGSVIIAAVAISALVAIIVLLLATDGVVANSFKTLIESFFNRAAGTITPQQQIREGRGTNTSPGKE